MKALWALLFCAGFVSPCVAQPLDEKLVSPIIAGYGGVVSLPKAAESPRKGTRVVFDVTADSKPADVNKGLERAARLLNLFGVVGLKASDVRIVVVLHGDATKVALTDAAYKKSCGAAKNPNLPLVRALREAEVEVFVCGQALHYKKFATADVANGLTISQAALTVVLNRQADGYACIPVP